MTARDIRYGRQGGRVVPWDVPTGLLVYDDAGQPREPTDTELERLAGDARLRVAQHAIRQSIAARRRPL